MEGRGVYVDDRVVGDSGGLLGGLRLQPDIGAPTPATSSASRGRPGRPGPLRWASLRAACTCLRGFRPFALAATAIEFMPADASAPRGVSLNRKFLRPMTNGLMPRSARLLSSGGLPSSSAPVACGQCLSASPSRFRGWRMHVNVSFIRLLGPPSSSSMIKA